MGFNPNRKMKRRPFDYVLVVCTLAIVFAFVIWAFRG